MLFVGVLEANRMGFECLMLFAQVAGETRAGGSSEVAVHVLARAPREMVLVVTGANSKPRRSS